MQLKKFLYMLLLILSLSLIGYFSYQYCTSTKYYIGVSLPLSGDQANNSRELVHGIELMVEKINSSQELGSNTKLELLIRDDKNDPIVAKEVAQDLVKNKQLVAVIGPYYLSTLMGGAQEIYAQNNIVILAPYEGLSAETKASPFVFSINYANSSGAEHMAIYLKEILQKNNVLIVHNNDDFGQASKVAFAEKAQNIGLHVEKAIFYDHHKKFGADFISSNLTAEDKQKIDAVVVFAHKDSGVKLVKQLREFGINSIIMGPHTFSSRKYLNDLTEEQGKDVYLISPFLYEIANEKALDFSEQFHAKYSYTPGNTVPLAADAVVLLAEALKNIQQNQTKSSSQISLGEDIKNFFQGLTMQTAIEGLTGNLFFNKTNNIDRNVFVSHIADGSFKLAYKQLTLPRENYVLEQLPERIEKGYIKVIDNKPYHLVDVVFVGIDFMKINDIDPKNMVFDTDLFLWFKWKNPNIDISQINFINVMQQKERNVLKEYTRGDVKYCAYKTKASFFIPFDLGKFPFDYQHLPVYLAHKNKHTEHIMLAFDIKHMDNTPIADITPPEWHFKEMKNSSILYRFSSTFGDVDYRQGKEYKSKIYFSTTKAKIVVKRKLLPYIFNLFLPLFVILAISLLILKIPVDQFVLRTNTTSTSIMSILLYYLAQKSALPKVGYMMKADYYFILLFIFILILQFFNIVIIQRLMTANKKEDAERVNQRFLYFFVSLTCLAYSMVSLFI